MQPLYPACAGLDVHKETVVAGVRRAPARGKPTSVVRTFGTATAALRELADWLAGQGVTHVAMESTGVYWKPVWNLLEGRFQLLLCNARHIKQVPGRKTDVKDCEWIAQLLQHGLLRPSFVPAAAQRQLRELTRQRRQLVQTRVSVVNRVQKVLEDANVKLASVATDIFGVSGRAMLRGLVDGVTDPEALAQRARGRLRAKLPQLREALEGRVTDHHRFALRLLLDEVDALGALALRVSQQVEAALTPEQARAVGLLATVPGIDERAAESVVAEVGCDMGQFPTAGHLASWAGVCPGNNESAGKRRSGRAAKGNAWLRATLVQCAWAASHTKGTYLRALYRRLAARRGRKRALVAVAHALLVSVYHVLKKGEPYRELGGDYLDRLGAERLTRGLVRRLERLGHKVTLEASEPQA